MPNDYRGVVYTDIVGLGETAEALNQIATEYPKLFKQALGAEVYNLKRSIASTLKNYKILKAVPVPNLTQATSYTGYNLVKKSPITKLLQGPKHVSALARPGSIKIQSIPNGFEVGHFGGLSRYAISFQEGVPRNIDNSGKRHWMYEILGPKMDIHSYEQLVAAIMPVSPPRPYINVLADKCRRDFIPGLVKLFEMIANREMKKLKKGK